jgi:hypothetical protein
MSAQTPPITPEAAAATVALAKIAEVATAAVTPVVISPPFSMKGWLLTEELKRNAKFFKNILNFDATILGLDQVMAGKMPVISGHVLLIVGASLLVAVFKIALDAGQYLITRQTIPPTPQT